MAKLTRTELLDESERNMLMRGLLSKAERNMLMRGLLSKAVMMIEMTAPCFSAEALFEAFVAEETRESCRVARDLFPGATLNRKACFQIDALMINFYRSGDSTPIPDTLKFHPLTPRAKQSVDRYIPGAGEWLDQSERVLRDVFNWRCGLDMAVKRAVSLTELVDVFLTTLDMVATPHEADRSFKPGTRQFNKLGLDDQLWIRLHHARSKPLTSRRGWGSVVAEIEERAKAICAGVELLADAPNKQPWRGEGMTIFRITGSLSGVCPFRDELADYSI